MNMFPFNKIIHRHFLCFLVFSLLFSLSCVPFYRHHNQNKAAEVALKFSKDAFVEQDFVKAFSYVVTERPVEFDVSKLEEMVRGMHPSGNYPKDIKATDYEIVPNSGIIKIYLEGKGNNEETHFYCIFSVPENDDYKIHSIYRNKENTPYPKTPLRQPLNKN